MRLCLLLSFLSPPPLFVREWKALDARLFSIFFGLHSRSFFPSRRSLCVSHTRSPGLDFPFLTGGPFPSSFFFSFPVPGGLVPPGGFLYRFSLFCPPANFHPPQPSQKFSGRTQRLPSPFFLFLLPLYFLLSFPWTFGLPQAGTRGRFLYFRPSPLSMSVVLFVFSGWPLQILIPSFSSVGFGGWILSYFIFLIGFCCFFPPPSFTVPLFLPLFPVSTLFPQFDRTLMFWQDPKMFFALSRFWQIPLWCKAAWS